jgi:predicted glycogen debranching enzyme
MSPIPDAGKEWLEADGLGGFAMGTRSGIRTRRYHGLLLAAATPPTGRVMLLNGYEAEVITPAGRYALTTQRYAPDVSHPNGVEYLEEFSTDPWPRWRHHFPDGTQIESELFAVHGAPRVVLRFRATTKGAIQLVLRPLCSGRDYHALHRENAAFRFDVEQTGSRARLQPYSDQPAIFWWSNADYQAAPEWYRNFQYDEERRRGLDFIEDLASPGVLRWDLSRGPAVWILAADLPGLTQAELAADPVRAAERDADRERTRRAAFASSMQRAADAYVVTRGRGSTLIAGYPWFTDWGRDTFIALRGLCIATGRLELARSILVEWSSAVSEGMLPNRFADRGEAPEYNSVDASLWYVIAVADFLRACSARSVNVTASDRSQLRAACEAILDGYSRGTRHGIRRDHDGLLAAGEPGTQLTWMDAKVGDWVVTPRIGKPVEIQALWLNALAFGATWSDRWRESFERGRETFELRFWNEDKGALYDVVDVDHRPGENDPALRPNQVFAIGGLPEILLSRERALRVLANVEARLVTPLGLRSLAPGEPGYTPHYAGGSRERDGAYHQGTVWPWLIGPFVDAYVRLHGNTPSVRSEARRKFLAPLLAEIERSFGHLTEIADAEAPHLASGCPFQAWSLGEVLRLDLDVLAEPARETAPTTSAAGPTARAYSR